MKWIFLVIIPVHILGLQMVLVKAGSFAMGDNVFEWDGPVHTVKISYDFYISKYEITNGDFVGFLNEVGKFIKRTDHSGYVIKKGTGKVILGYVGISGKREYNWYDQILYDVKKGIFLVRDGYGKYPVIFVTWMGAVEYARWLSRKEGLPDPYNDRGVLVDASGKEAKSPSTVKGYRLCTEAEWEYAARGGKTGSHVYSGGDDPDLVAWYMKNSDWKTHPVGTKSPNELGIYDMSGNVWEWVQDSYRSYPAGAEVDPLYQTPTGYRVARGGSWYDPDKRITVSYRIYIPSPVIGDEDIGFRLCRTAH